MNTQCTKGKNEFEKKNWKNTILERMENNMLKWNGYALHTGDNRWPKQPITWLPHKKRERERKGRSKMWWEREVEGMTKQKMQ